MTPRAGRRDDRARSVSKGAARPVPVAARGGDRCRTKGVMTPALAPRARADTNAGLATVDDVCLATRQKGTAVTDCGLGPLAYAPPALGQRVRAVRRAYGLREKRARGRVRGAPARIIELRGRMAWSTIVRRRTSWNPLHSWIALAGAGRRRPCPGITEADRLVTKGFDIHRTRRRSRRSLPSCAPAAMAPTESGFAA